MEIRIKNKARQIRGQYSEPGSKLTLILDGNETAEFAFVYLNEEGQPTRDPMPIDFFGWRVPPQEITAGVLTVADLIGKRADDPEDNYFARWGEAEDATFPQREKTNGTTCVCWMTLRPTKAADMTHANTSNHAPSKRKRADCARGGRNKGKVQDPHDKKVIIDAFKRNHKSGMKIHGAATTVADRVNEDTLRGIKDGPYLISPDVVKRLAKVKK